MDRLHIDLLKFRIFDKKNNLYCKLDNISIDGNGFINIENKKYDLSDNEFNELYKIERSTGVLDKNGKLIYEGDIIEYCYNHFIDTVTSSKFQIRFSKYTMRFILGKSTMSLNIENSNKYEIIGNINENKDIKTEQN